LFPLIGVNANRLQLSVVIVKLPNMNEPILYYYKS